MSKEKLITVCQVTGEVMGYDPEAYKKHPEPCCTDPEVINLDDEEEGEGE